MPEFTFTSPSGESYKMTGPEGSSKEQAFEKFKSMKPDLFKAPVKQIMGFDPMGMPTGATVPELPPNKMPYGEQMGNVGEATGQFARGVATGVPAGVVGIPGNIEAGVIGVMGIPGKIEALARTALSPFGVKRETTFPESPFGVERETIFPESSQLRQGIRDLITDEPETIFEKVGGGVGELIGPSALGRALRFGVTSALGRPSVAANDLARTAEDLGFRLEPGMLKPSSPVKSPGFAGNAARNQSLSNRLVTRETGVEAGEITPRFVGERLTDLGRDYDAIFGGPIRADRQLIGELQNIADFERRVNPASVVSATRASENIVNRYNQAVQNVGQNVTAVAVDGRDIQRLRNELSRVARTATDGNDRRIAYQFVERIDDAIARTNPNIAARLAETNRKYAATKTLEDLIDKGAIRQGNISLERLGDHLAQNVYGYGSGRSRHPLLDLGTIGRELGLRARWEGSAGASDDIIKSILGKSGRILGGATGLRTQAARRAQRGESLLPPGAGLAAGVPSLVAPDEGN